jgi:hypothetical protein
LGFRGLVAFAFKPWLGARPAVHPWRFNAPLLLSGIVTMVAII